MAKSISQQKKEARDYVGSLRKAAGRIGTSQAMYDLYRDKLAACKTAADLKEWYGKFSARVNGQIGQDKSEAAFMRSQLDSLRSLFGLRP